MGHLAMTGIDTAAMISRIFLGDAMRATPPSARICAGTRSSAMTATAPACSAMVACSALVTSMMTPPLSISARPVLRRREVGLPLFFDMVAPRSGYQLLAGSDQLTLGMMVPGGLSPLNSFYSRGADLRNPGRKLSAVSCQLSGISKSLRATPGGQPRAAVPTFVEMQADS